MTNHILSPDTQATLLLCASFGSSRKAEPKPLSLGEYNNLASWLQDNDLTPQDLLLSIIQNKLPHIRRIIQLHYLINPHARSHF